MDPKEHIRRDILWGCSRCPQTRGWKQARNTQKTNTNTLQSHVRAQHPECTDWEELRIHGGWQVKCRDGSILHIPFEGNEHLTTKHANRSRDSQSKQKSPTTKALARSTVSRSTKASRTTRQKPATSATRTSKRRPARSTEKVTVSDAEDDAEASILSGNGADNDWLDDETPTLLRKPLQQSNGTNIPANLTDRPAQASSVLSNILAHYDTKRHDLEARMARVAGPSPTFRSLSSTATGGQAPILLPTEVLLSPFDREVMQGIHGEELRALGEAALIRSTAERVGVPRERQWFDLAVYLAERGNAALGERGQGMTLPINLDTL